MSGKACLMGAGLVVVSALAYLPVNWAGFLWDDPSYLLDNPTIKDPAGLRRIFLSPLASPQYYPMVFAGFWAEYRLWGFDPLGYHRVNVAFHACNAVMAWRAARRLVPSGAWLAGAIFALHPVHVESVAWIAERKNVQSTFFTLASLLAYWRFAPPDGPPSRSRAAWHGLAFLLYLGALGSKTVACSLPAAILVIGWARRGRVGLVDVGPLVPFFVAGLAAGSLTAWLEKHHVGASGPEWAIPPVDRALIAGRALWFYAGKLAWPAGLCFIYPRWRVDPRVGWQWAFPIAAVTVVAGLWAARARVGRGPLAGVLCFAGVLLPALGFFDIYPMRFSFVADHFQYLASLGLIVPAAAALAALARRIGRPGAVALATLLMALGGATFARSRAFRDAETIWSDTLATNPGSWIAANNLGTLRLNRGEPEQARPHFEAALRLEPDYVEALSNLGTALELLDRLPEAEAHLVHALRVRPDYWRAHYALGRVRKKQGRDVDAAAEFRRTLQIRPDHRGARLELRVVAPDGPR